MRSYPGGYICQHAMTSDNGNSLPFMLCVNDGHVNMHFLGNLISWLGNIILYKKMTNEDIG